MIMILVALIFFLEIMLSVAKIMLPTEILRKIKITSSLTLSILTFILNEHLCSPATFWSCSF